MSLSRSSSSVSSTTSPYYEDDLFKKFKLKHHRTIQTTNENDDHIDMSNSDEWTSKSTTPELDVEPHFKNYYIQPNTQLKFPQYLLTPDIDELQQKEIELVQSFLD
jgi:hypothetical protein